MQKSRNATQDDAAEFAEFMAWKRAQSSPDAATAKVLADMPNASQSRAGSATTAPIVRKLDTREVQVNDSVSFVITPTVDGRPATNGARVVPMLKGKRQRSLTDALLDAMGVPASHPLRKAIAQVERAALIGPHAPVKGGEDE